MTLRELRAKKRITQAKAAEIAAAGLGDRYKMNQVRWSILEAIDVEFIKALEEVFDEKIDIPAGDVDD